MSKNSVAMVDGHAQKNHNPPPVYLVTGAAGFIGSHTVDRLLADGYRVIGVDNLRTGNLGNLDAARQHPLFEFIECDISDEQRASELFARQRARGQDFAGALHLAALVSVPESIEQPDLNARLNVWGGDLLARLCLRYGCRRLVFASSAAVYGNAGELPNRETALPQPLSPYAAAKLATENLLAGYAASFGLETVCFRYFNIYGPRQDPSSAYSGVLSIFTDRMRQGLPITVHGDGEQSRDFVAVSDVASANVMALTAAQVDSGVYNVCTGQSVTLNHVLALYRERFPQAPAPRYGPPRPGDVRQSLGDPSRLNAHFGWQPMTPFADGLQALVG